MNFSDFLYFKENFKSRDGCYKNAVIVEGSKGGKARIVENGKTRVVWKLVLTIDVTSHAAKDKLSPITSSVRTEVTALMPRQNVSQSRMKDIIVEALTTVMKAENCIFSDDVSEEEES